jgi:hypothetical protein
VSKRENNISEGYRGNKKQQNAFRNIGKEQDECSDVPLEGVAALLDVVANQIDHSAEVK